MRNPFVKSEMQKAAELQQQEETSNLSYGLATAQENIVDEQAMQDRKDLLAQLNQWQQDRSPQMRNLFLKLSGYQVDTENNTLIPVKWDKPFLTLSGSQKLVGFIESLDHNVMLGNWEDKTILLTLRESISHPIRRFIKDNHKLLGLHLNNAEFVLWMVINSVEPTYRRGWNNGERRKDMEITKIHELRNSGYQPKKKTMFGIES